MTTERERKGRREKEANEWIIKESEEGKRRGKKETDGEGRRRMIE